VLLRESVVWAILINVSLLYCGGGARIATVAAWIFDWRGLVAFITPWLRWNTYGVATINRDDDLAHFGALWSVALHYYGFFTSNWHLGKTGKQTQ